jgi:hypothetical protein
MGSVPMLTPAPWIPTTMRMGMGSVQTSMLALWMLKTMQMVTESVGMWTPVRWIPRTISMGMVSVEMSIHALLTHWTTVTVTEFATE